jgi:hypothetical protein
MRPLLLALCATPLLTTVACKPSVRATPPVAAAPAELVALTGAAVLIGAGDIANCNSNGDEQTARLVDSVLRADSGAKVPDEVFLLGDNAYPNGSASDYATCFTPSWGDSAKLIMKNIRPTPGNHEHLTFEAAPYYQYFGNRAGSSKKGYYSYDVGEWHVIVLNSEIVVNGAFSADDRKNQEDWLTEDLKGHKQKCTLAYWHHPRFSSGWHGSDPRIGAFWVILYAGGADLILNGHDHDYERFLPQTPLATLDSANGMTEIVVGTGGGELRGFNRPVPNSETRIQGHFGVLKLTLGATEWRSAFLDVNGGVWDQAGGKCH